MMIRYWYAASLTATALCVIVVTVSACTFDVKYPSQYQDASGDGLGKDAHPETIVPDVGEDGSLPDNTPGDYVGPDIPPPCGWDADCDASLGSPGECQVWTCQSNECMKRAAQNDSPCNDSDLCTDMDSCFNGQCRGTSVVFCETAVDPCTESFCNPSTGLCETTWIPGCTVDPCVEEGGLLDPWGTGGVVPMDGGISPPIGEYSECCQGLYPVSDCRHDDGVVCIPEEDCGAPCRCTPLMVCTFCGDGTCSSWETPCNCPTDCWVGIPIPDCEAIGGECKEAALWWGTPEGDGDNPDIAMYSPCPERFAHVDFPGCEIEGKVCCVQAGDDPVVSQ